MHYLSLEATINNDLRVVRSGYQLTDLGMDIDTTKLIIFRTEQKELNRRHYFNQNMLNI